MSILKLKKIDSLLILDTTRPKSKSEKILLLLDAVKYSLVHTFLPLEDGRKSLEILGIYMHHSTFDLSLQLLLPAYLFFYKDNNHVEKSQQVPILPFDRFHL